MNTNQNTVSIHKLARSFEKIYKGLDKHQISEMDKELIKMYPSKESEVLLSTDYGEEENSMGVSIYVSKPLAKEKLEPISFDKLMFENLIRADISKLTNVSECIELMERKGSNTYEIDFIPVFYNEELKDYYIHFRITRNI